MGRDSVKRLQKDLKALLADPVEDVWVVPNDRDIHEWHFVIRGAQGTPYEDGLYHGKILFPNTYPWAPPGIVMLTPSGRFHPGQRICLSISDFHPETWSASIRVASILLSLVSFMNEETPSTGAITGVAEAARRKMAGESLRFNVDQSQSAATFKRLFPAMAQPGWTLPARKATAGGMAVAGESSSKGKEKLGLGEAGAQGARPQRRRSTAAAKPPPPPLDRQKGTPGLPRDAQVGAGPRPGPGPGMGPGTQMSSRQEIGVAVVALALAVYVLFYL